MQNSFTLSCLRTFSHFLSLNAAKRKLSILIYHRVMDKFEPLRAGEIMKDDFDWQVELLSRYYTVLPLSEAISHLQNNTLPARAVCITFDDGYADNESIALPILKRHNACATFFVATDYLNGGYMWNDKVIDALSIGPDTLDLTHLDLGTVDLGSTELRIKAMENLLPKIKYLPTAQREKTVDNIANLVGSNRTDLMMTDAQVKNLHAAGMEIGGHTQSHPILANITEKQAMHEIGGGREILQSLVGNDVKSFAYPNGKPGKDYTNENVLQVKKCGFDAAVSTHWGVSNKSTDRFQLARFTPWDKTPANFSLRLLRNYSGI